MGKIFVTSDWHFNHDREFIWKARGFNSIEEMNQAIIERHNSIITPEDDVYVLGDLMLGGPDRMNEGLELIKQMNGKLHIVRGNHDTERRWLAYPTLPNVVEHKDAIYLKCGKYHFYLTHFPCLTGNLEKETLTQMTLNLYGHTHQKSNFFEDRPYMYHVGVDSHECYPICLTDIVAAMRNKVIECKEQL